MEKFIRAHDLITVCPCRAVGPSGARSSSPSRFCWCACSSPSRSSCTTTPPAVARERFADALTSLSESVMTNLDAQVAEMNRLSLTLIYSRVFQGLYARHLALPRSPATAEQRIAKLENTEALIEISETILGPNRVGAAGQCLRPAGRDDRGRVLQPPHRAGRDARALVRRGHARRAANA